MNTLVLIDAQALIHRSYHALPPLTTPKGEPANAVFGFATVFVKMIRDLFPTHIAACFDLPEPTFRHKEYDKYKATRAKTPDELISQIDKVKRLLDIFGVPVFEQVGFEADDLLGTIVKQVKSAKTKAKNIEKIIIVTGDLDLLQLVDDQVGVYTLRRGMQDTVMYDAAAVMERYGLAPGQLTDLRGLRGDASDNIPGVPGIGEKTASALLQEFGTLEALYEAAAHPEKGGKDQKSALKGKVIEKLIANKDQAVFSKYLATIRDDAPIALTMADLEWKGADEARAKVFFEEMGFRSLINRIPQQSTKSALASAQGQFAFGGSLEAPEPERKDIGEVIEDHYKRGIFSKRIYDVERALMPIIEKMEHKGILMDVSVLERVGKDVAAMLETCQKEIFALSGQEFNILSPPQLSKILFEKLAIPSKGMRKTPGGVTSTQVSELLKIRDLHPIVALVERYRELAKLKSTYIDALPLLINPKDGRLHTTYNQLGAETGRLSSENPNLQNIPMRTELGRRIRAAFIAPRGHKLLSADYSQIELRIAAVMSEDETLLQAFRRGDDIHTITASQMFGIPQDKVDSDTRRKAKIINFGILYGMGIQGLAEAANISRTEAKEYIEKYFKTFPGITKYVEETKRKARELGYVESLFGRRRYISGLDSRDVRMRLAAERAAINAPVQSTATADIIKMAMVALSQKLPIFDDKIHLLLQVHDELVFEVREDVVEDVAPAIKKIMESVVEFPIPLVVDLKIGDNWEEMTPIIRRESKNPIIP